MFLNCWREPLYSSSFVSCEKTLWEALQRDSTATHSQLHCSQLHCLSHQPPTGWAPGPGNQWQTSQQLNAENDDFWLLLLVSLPPCFPLPTAVRALMGFDNCSGIWIPILQQHLYFFFTVFNRVGPVEAHINPQRVSNNDGAGVWPLDIRERIPNAQAVTVNMHTEIGKLIYHVRQE